MIAIDRLDIVTLAQLRDLNDRMASEGMMRARCMVVPVDPITALCRVLGRYKMYVDLRDIGFVPHLMFEGYWEYWITDFVWRNVKPGQVAVDVGANHGYYTLLLADLIGAAGTLHAFEPNPRLAELLELTVNLNGFGPMSRLHAAAVGQAGGGRMPFIVPVRDPKNAYVLDNGRQVPKNLDPSRFVAHEVPVLPLDEAVPGPVDFIKIDVEGAEEAVWRGMQKLIDRSPDIAILCEFNPHRCASPRATLDEMASRFPLREVGFTAQATDCDIATILDRREDTMLYLSRRTPE